MKLILLAVGSKHEAYVHTGIVDFTRRIQHYFPCDWKILPASKQSAPQLVLQNESRAVKAFWDKEKAFNVLLDERGKQLTSPGLAECIAKAALESRKTICFTIGGAFGVDDELRQQADLVLSLSKMVFPHQLVRLILAEQVYRACTINRGEKYHHT